MRTTWYLHKSRHGVYVGSVRYVGVSLETVDRRAAELRRTWREFGWSYEITDRLSRGQRARQTFTGPMERKLTTVRGDRQLRFRSLERMGV